MNNYQDKEPNISEMENSLNKEVVSKIMTCNELNRQEMDEVNKWLDSLEEIYDRNERHTDQT